MRLQDIMSTNVQTVPPSASVADARTLMRTKGIHHLVVVNKGKIIGIVSDRDLGGRVRARSGGDESASVADVMVTNPVSASSDMTVRQAANLLRGRGIGCLPITDGTRPVGIITTTDLLELIGRGVERPIVTSTRWTLRSRGVGLRTTPTARHARQV